MVDSWCKKNEMQLNKKKCGIFRLKIRSKKFSIGKDLRITDDPPTEWIMEIPIVGNYKYLGVVFDDAMSAKPHILHLTVKLAKFSRICMNLRIQGVNHKVFLKLFTTFLQSVLEYGCLVFHADFASQALRIKYG